MKLNLGLSWEHIARRDIFKPLSMNDTTFINDDFASWNLHAQQYMKDDYNDIAHREMSLLFQYMFYNGSTASGGISSNAIDMAQWLKMLLKGGLADDNKRVVNEAVFR